MIRILHEAELPNLEVNPKEVWYWLGYSDPMQARPAMQKVFNQAMEKGPSFLEPAACYDIFPIAGVTPFSVEVKGGVVFESQDLASRFQGARELAAFIVTIGPHLEEEVKQFFCSGNAGVGYVLDVFGSTAVDVVAYKVREVIQGYASSKGYQAMTYGCCIGESCPAYTDCGGVMIYWWSPGYGDFLTREQKKLFSLIDGSHIGVHLAESCMMTPRKSYACLLPIGPQLEKSPRKCDEGQKDWIKLGSLKPMK